MTVGKVLARFWCQDIRHSASQARKPGSQDEPQSAEVTLRPVYGDENKPWSQYTPQGEIKMLITNPAAVEFFNIGETYDIAFTPVTSPDD